MAPLHREGCACDGEGGASCEHGWQSLKNGRFDRAIAQFTAAIQAGSKDAGAYYGRGLARVKKQPHDLQGAVADFTEAIRLQPGYRGSYVNRGSAYLELGDPQRAVSDYDEAIRIDPRYATAYYGRGAVYFRKHEFEKAISDFSIAIRIDPAKASFFSSRGLAYKRINNLTKALADYNETIRLEPNNTDAYIELGNVHSSLGSWDEAAADFDKAIRLRPNSPGLYEARGVSWINCNDYERGSADVKTAIRLNPTDPAATFEPWSKAPVEATLKHGEQQVDQMLHDRPAMGQYGKKADVLCQWAARKFAGEDLRRRIFWDASALPSDIAGGNCSSPEEETGLICVSAKYLDGPKKGKDRTFEELWCNAVFELYNITNADEFWRLKAEAAKGKMSKEDFVTKTIECESRVAEKLRSFYIHVLMPWAKESRVPTHPQCWFVGQPDRAEAYRERSGHTEAYRQSYERSYDETILISLFRKGEYQKALDLAKKMKEQANTKEERVVFRRYSADCLLHLNKLFPAIDAYKEVIRFDSKDADAYLGRATAYAMLNDMDHAIADFTEAVRLKPWSPEAYQLRGDAYEAMNDAARATADFATAKQLTWESEHGRNKKTR